MSLGALFFCAGLRILLVNVYAFTIFSQLKKRNRPPDSPSIEFRGVLIYANPCQFARRAPSSLMLGSKFTSSKNNIYQQT
jgi:hypothetical protein